MSKLIDSIFKIEFSNIYIIFLRMNLLVTEDQLFKSIDSITKLQKAMGHSSINVSLTYLRGLEIAELKEEDMPMV